MPHVKSVRVPKRRCNPPPRFAQAKCQVIIFAAPADEAFIETVHRFKIFAGNSNVVTRKLWFLWMAGPMVVLAFNADFEQTLAFLA